MPYPSERVTTTLTFDHIRETFYRSVIADFNLQMCEIWILLICEVTRTLSGPNTDNNVSLKINKSKSFHRTELVNIISGSLR